MSAKCKRRNRRKQPRTNRRSINFLQTKIFLFQFLLFFKIKIKTSFQASYTLSEEYNKQAWDFNQKKLSSNVSETEVYKNCHLSASSKSGLLPLTCLIPFLMCSLELPLVWLKMCASFCQTLEQTRKKHHWISKINETECASESASANALEIMISPAFDWKCIWDMQKQKDRVQKCIQIERYLIVEFQEMLRYKYAHQPHDKATSDKVNHRRRRRRVHWVSTKIDLQALRIKKKYIYIYN